MVIYELKGSVSLAAFHCPNGLNALNLGMFRRLINIFKTVAP